MARRRAISRADRVSDADWDCVYDSLVGRVWNIGVAKLCVEYTKRPGWLYVSVQFNQHNIPIVLTNLHITLAYAVCFPDYQAFHRFHITARSLLSSAAPFAIKLRRFGGHKGCYAVDTGCEMFALIRMLQEMLPQGTNISHTPHVSWPPQRFVDWERTLTVQFKIWVVAPRRALRLNLFRSTTHFRLCAMLSVKPRHLATPLGR